MEEFLRRHRDDTFGSWFDQLEKVIREKRAFLNQAKGNFAKYQKVVRDLPELTADRIDLESRAVTVQAASDPDPEVRDALSAGLKGLCPWRKGPFSLFDVTVDSEWQSWMKWERIRDCLPPLTDAKILDIGSSNGYYMFKMAKDSPRFVLGLEPQSTFYCQYLAIQKYLKLPDVFCLPLPFHELPPVTGCFDIVFCMGVLYHRKSPVEMLSEIRDILGENGTLVLENLVIKGENNLCLFPRDRYAKMRNVFFIPDLSAMTSWLERAGFKDIRLVDVTATGVEEQRWTEWIQTESLVDFLDPEDPSRTVEGYPAPVRAVFTARA